MGSDTYDDDGSPHRRPGLLKDQILLVKRKNSDRCEIAPIKTYLSFEKGFFIVIRACQLLAQSNDGIVLVGLAGPSGAGKTVFTEKILNFMPGVAVISMDNYNDSSRIVDGNYDDPRLTDYDALLKNIDELKNGTTANIPVYDFKSSSRVGYRTLEVPSSRIVIIEGIYALSERLRPLLDLRVSVEGGVHVDLVKRVLRDIQRAGQEPAAIIHQISETVYPMYKAFIEPDLQTAHIKISNKFNPFTGFQNPTYVLKSWKALSPDEIRRCFVSDSCVETSEQTYDIYLLPPGEDPESCQSYLRMRNKEGKYNLMFEEWVTDSPFVISPRISFEVSVRLLGGLMALGYTIAAILQRNSHIFSDDRISVKIDWLEQLNRQYIQVQGRERAVVKSVGDELGLEGSYIPRTYIEQIQLEKLMKEVMEVPEDLRTKLSLDEDVIGSPQDLFSRQFVASRYRHRGLNGSTTTRMNGYPDKNQQQQHHSENGHARGEKIVELSEQISTLNDRMDEFTYRIEEFSSKMVTTEGGVAPPKNHRHLKDDVCSNGSTSPAYLSLKIPKDVALSDEIMAIARGQRQIMHQLDGLCSLIKCDLGRRSTQQVGVETWSDFTGIRFPLVFTLAFGSLGILLVKGVLHGN